MEDPAPGADPRADESFEMQAADGGMRYPSVVTLTDLINLLGDGTFNQSVADEIHAFSADLESIGCDEGKKVKGAITLKIEVEREQDGIYYLKPDLTFKLPKQPRGRTLAWVTPDNRLTPNRPRQGNFFGTMRDVSSETKLR